MLMAISGKGEAKANGAARKQSGRHVSAKPDEVARPRH
jgi:hypothetical protein